MTRITELTRNVLNSTVEAKPIAVQAALHNLDADRYGQTGKRGSINPLYAELRGRNEIEFTIAR